MEKQIRLFFSIFVLTSSGLILLFQENHNVIALILMLTAIFGVFRFYEYLNLRNPEIPKNLSLSSRLLFGLKDQKRINLFFNQINHPSLMALIVFTILYVIWAIYCSLHPINIPILDFFWQQKSQIYEGLNLNIHKGYSIIFRLSEWMIPILFFAIGMTMSLPRKINLSIAIFGTVLIGVILYVSNNVSVTNYTDYNYLRGLGLGSYNNFMMALNQSPDSQPQSFFTRRYIEAGLIGAYGLYFIFAPLAFVFVKTLNNKNQTMTSILALIILGALMAFDFLYALSAYALSIQIIIFSILGVLFANQLYPQKTDA